MNRLAVAIGASFTITTMTFMLSYVMGRREDFSLIIVIGGLIGTLILAVEVYNHRKKTMKREGIIMICRNCKKPIEWDLEADMIHTHLNDKGVDPRMCEPTNPNSKVAEFNKKVKVDETERSISSN